MIPYGELLFFYVLALLSIPAVILGLKGRRIKWYGIIVNLFMLFLLFGNSAIQVLSLVMFYAGELILIKIYLYINRRFKSRWLMRLAVFFSIMPLLLVKSSSLFIDKPIGFLGISYVTFKCIQMLIEIYDGLIKEVNIFDFTYFLLFFPTISSGPIDRSRRFMEDINHVPSGEEYKKLLKTGIWKIFTGIAYKFIISLLVYNFWLGQIRAGSGVLSTISYMYAYSMYLFFDFAGYSLMAVGTSYLLGVRTPPNFDKPFLSRDIKDFWNRWHISLSTWFRDFIYTRFVMQSLKKKRFKSRYTASYIAYIITMGTMGIWHGTELNYIVYGLYHGILIIATDFFQRKSKWYKKVKDTPSYGYISVLVTFNLVCFGFLIFSGFLFK